MNEFWSFDAAMMVAIGSAAVAFLIALTMIVDDQEVRDGERQDVASLRELPNVIRSLPRMAFSIAVFAESCGLGALAASFRAYGRDIIRVSLGREVLLLAPAALLGTTSVGIGGAAADRLSRRVLLIAGFAVSGVSLVLLSEWTNLTFIAIAAAVAAVGFGLAVPSIGASMMALAGPARTRGGVIGWFMSADGLGQSVGPAAAGALVGAAGTESALLMVGLLFLAVAAFGGASSGYRR